MSCSGLYRDRERGLILGVCAGIAERFALHANALRVVALVALALAFWPVLLSYLTAGYLLRDRPLRYRGRGPEEHFWRSGSERWS